MITLSFLNGPRAGEVISLPDGEWTVGRAPDNAIVIPDPSVSARHAELLVSFGEVIVTDPGARNGTFVDGRRVEAQCLVGAGQGVRFGAVDLRVLFATDDDSRVATSVTAAHAMRQPESALPPHPEGKLTANTATIRADLTQIVPPPPPTRPADSPAKPANLPNAPTQRWHQPGWTAGLGAVILILLLWLLLR
jgi:pSer/pThr/pTyr-binding forkhead associated (FHA) protein